MGALSEAAEERKAARLLAGLGLLTLKLNVQGQVGWPDRLVVLPGGRVLFVEMKLVGGKATARQVLVHRALRGLGHRVETCSSAAEVVALAVEASE